MANAQKSRCKLQPADYFVVLGVLSIAAGGIVSAIFAHEPGRFVMWAAAYLVLAAGLVQVALGFLLKHLAPQNMERNLYTAVMLYNVGGLGVIAGTALKTSLVGPTVLVLADAMFLLALLTIAYSVRTIRRSILLAFLYILLAVLFVSTLVGLFLSTVIRLS